MAPGMRIHRKSAAAPGLPEKTPKKTAPREGKENDDVFQDESDVLRRSAAENYFMQGKGTMLNKARRGRGKRRSSDGSSDEEMMEENEDEAEDKQLSLQALSSFMEEASRKKLKDVKAFSSEFPYWKTVLLGSEFNICLIGAGSKKALMDLFMADLGKQNDTVCFEGYREEATARNILSFLLETFKIKKGAGRDLISCARQITKHLEEKQRVLYVFLHNIDSASLRDQSDQAALAALCSTPWLRLCTSIDHMKATILWDTHHSNLFNWAFVAADTFDFCLPALVASKSDLLGLNPKNNHSAHTMSSLDVLWQSLAGNSRKIFTLFFAMTYSTGQGVPFWDLFREARDEFLVSTDAALRQLLVEFEDHRVLNRRRREDGNENLIACLDRQLVEKFLDEKGVSLEM